MALVTRWFGPTSSGAGDGSSVADCAALYSEGAWSPVITGFDFSSNGLEARIVGGASYAIATTLSQTSFSGTLPSALYPLILHGCDPVTGERLVPPVTWTADQPFDSSSLPSLEATGNFSMISLSGVTALARMVRFYNENRLSGALVSFFTLLDWCELVQASSGTSISCLDSSSNRVTNCSLKCTGDTYDCIGIIANSFTWENVRLEGNPSATGGDRDGISAAGSTGERSLRKFVILNSPGHGINDGNGNVNQRFMIHDGVIYNCGGSGILFPSIVGHANVSQIRRCMIVHCGEYGINSAGVNTYASRNRLRDNALGNFNGMGNWPEDFENETGAGTDADEFVDAANGDLRIKAGSSLHGRGFGVSDEPASGGGSGLVIPSFSGGFQ